MIELNGKPYEVGEGVVPGRIGSVHRHVFTAIGRVVRSAWGEFVLVIVGHVSVDSAAVGER